jgi:AcrR family transcriptional regulator
VSRRDEVLDAAIVVLGGEGTRRLTHRAVDAAAGVPAGTTSNHFRSREALLDGIVTRLAELDRVDWTVLAGRAPEAGLTPEAVTAALAGFVRYALGPGRPRTAARYALFLEAAGQPEMRARLAQGRAAIAGWAVAWLSHLGSPDPTAHTRIMLNYVDGVLLGQLCFVDPAFDPAPGIDAVLTGLLGR